MAYKKRRYNTKKNKTKRFNKYAYAKTDSRNQSKQIVQLNKKINNVYKTLRPELAKLHKTGEFKLSSASAVVKPVDSLLGQTYNNLFQADYAKLIYYNFKFFFNSSNIDLTQGKTIRVFIFQNRTGIDTIPLLSDIFQDSTQPIISSFKEGINHNYKILMDKIYTISSDKDYLCKSYNFKKLIGYNKLHKVYTEELTYGRGSMFVVFITTQATEFTVSYSNSLGYVDV